MDKKILFADLDGTLIETISGATFPKGIWDMKFKFDVLDKIKELGFECLIIVSNQGGIENGFVDERHFTKGKMNFIVMGLEEYLEIPVDYNYCSSNDKENHFRKPNIGMLNAACKNVIEKRFHMKSNKRNMLMIGDASGKEGQFSDSDKKTAENFGIEYMDIEDFINYKDEETMTREQAKQIALESIQKEIQKHGEDAIFMASPMRGKNSWTYKEALDAIINDVPLEGLDENPIDGILELDKWKKEQKNKEKNDAK